MNRVSFFLLSIVGVFLLSSVFFSGPTDAYPVLQLTITPTAFNYLPFVAKNWPPTPAPTVTPTPGPIVYQGMTDQNLPISITVLSDFSAVTRVRLTHHFSCGGITASGTITVSRDPGWPIENRAFRVEASCAYVVTGTFASDSSAVSGTWQGIMGKPFIIPCEELCRGPVGQWSATRQP